MQKDKLPLKSLTLRRGHWDVNVGKGRAMLYPFLAEFPGDAVVPSFTAHEIEGALRLNKLYSALVIPPDGITYENARNNIDLINASFHDQTIDMSTLPLCLGIISRFVFIICSLNKW